MSSPEEYKRLETAVRNLHAQNQIFRKTIVDSYNELVNVRKLKSPALEDKLGELYRTMESCYQTMRRIV